jgi:long-chain acyl-CoA synthetase
MGRTVAGVFQETARRHAGKAAYSSKKDGTYRTVTYGDLSLRVRELGTGLLAAGIRPEDKIGLISDNRPEWIICDLACTCIGAADVPRGSDSSVQEIEYILGHSDSVAAFVENEKQLRKVLSFRYRLPAIRFVAVMDPDYRAQPPEGVCRLADLIERGRALLRDGDQSFEEALGGIREENLATLIYTSGTTGKPKGVMLSHRNLMQNIEVIPGCLGITSADRFLSILPPWHIFERTVEYVVIAAGASLTYSSIRTFADDMAQVKPTFIASVPRIWEGVLTKVLASIGKQPPAKQLLFSILLGMSKTFVRARQILRGRETVYHPSPPAVRISRWLRALFTAAVVFPLHIIARKKFAPIRALTGGELRAAVSGGGALPAYVDWFFAAVGITLLEGYGLTETSPVLAFRTFDRQVLGTVGRPISGTEIKIVDERGEPLPPGEQGVIKCRGEQVMEGYYKNPEETARVIDADGWFDTGDLGRFTIRGELSLTGRAKETIVLLGGENVEPTPIEDALTESPYIAQVMVVGQDRKTLGALVVPNFNALRKWMTKRGLEGKDPEAICAKEGVVTLIREEIRRLIHAEHGFKPFEKIPRFQLLGREFSIGEELTQTLKKKRNVILERYSYLIEEMYTGS